MTSGRLDYKLAHPTSSSRQVEEIGCTTLDLAVSIEICIRTTPLARPTHVTLIPQSDISNGQRYPLGTVSLKRGWCGQRAIPKGVQPIDQDRRRARKIRERRPPGPSNQKLGTVSLKRGWCGQRAIPKGVQPIDQDRRRARKIRERRPPGPSNQIIDVPDQSQRSTEPPPRGSSDWRSESNLEPNQPIPSLQDAKYPKLCFSVRQVPDHKASRGQPDYQKCLNRLRGLQMMIQ
nr:hypothetical protein CFP56_10012 [Quercus suber]